MIQIRKILGNFKSFLLNQLDWDSYFTRSRRKYFQLYTKLSIKKHDYISDDLLHYKFSIVKHTTSNIKKGNTMEIDIELPA